MVRDGKGAADARYCCSPGNFRRQMGYLKRAGYQVVPLAEMVSALKSGDKLPRKTVALTFDDGFRDNFENALPVLREFAYPATIFVVSGLVGGINAWMRDGNAPERELVSWGELQQTAAEGIEVGSHTVTHTALDEMHSDELLRELKESKSEIERNLESKVRFFAYPYGRLNEKARKAVEAAGYEAACSTRSGFNNRDTDSFILRRIEVYGSDSLRYFALKVAWGTNDASVGLISRYYLSRIRARFERLF